MAWEVEYTDEFEAWWIALNEEEQRELRIQHEGKPYRILYAFDPRRVAILLIGGKKTGGKRWYEKYVPLAERIYETHLKSLTDEQGGGL